MVCAAKLRFGSSTNIPAGVGSGSPVTYDLDPSKLGQHDADAFKYKDYEYDGLSDSDEEEEGEVWIDLSKLGNVFSHEGSSLYLRLGELSECIICAVFSNVQ